MGEKNIPPKCHGTVVSIQDNCGRKVLGKCRVSIQFLFDSYHPWEEDLNLELAANSRWHFQAHHQFLLPKVGVFVVIFPTLEKRT